MKVRAGVWAAALVLMGAAWIAACGNPGQASQGDAPAGAGSARIMNVEVLTVQREPFAEQITVTGAVEAERDVTVSSEESGVIRELFVQKGQRVASGQPIARIDDRVLRAQYDQARSEAKLAAETYERQRRLWEDEQIGTELAYLRAKYGAETADANARVLEARLERTVVRAPIAGILEDRFVEVGSMVAPGTAVARVLDVDPLKVTAGVPERYAGEVRVGGVATVGFESAGLGEVRGRIRYVGTAVNEQNRTFRVEIDAPNAGGSLKPGIVARVRLERRSVAEAILVPRDAVLRSEGGYVVYTISGSDDALIAEARPVAPGSGQAGRVLIENGLTAGDRVVVVGQQQLAHGDRVRITTEMGGAR